jgi:type III pantothenate kinase
MINVTICFDFGNTRLKAAVFNSGEFVKELHLEDDSVATVAAILSQYQPSKTILSSVIHHNTGIEQLLGSASHFHLLSHQTKLNFTTPVGKPETIGADRLALVAAAVHFYPQMHNLVIALGSCITYNFVNQNHEFLGGGISPGMDMRFKAMHEHTAKLPLVHHDWNHPLIGYDTKTNLQSGVLYGMAGEIEGIIQQYQERYGNFNAVLTGGNSTHFAGRIKSKIFADQNFLFKGLYALSEINN